MVDTHCHLTFPQFRDRVPEVLAAARADGVSGLITVSTTVPDAVDAWRTAEAHTGVWCTAGVHPLYAHEGPHDWAALAAAAAHPKCVAWGELGLDSHYPEPAKPLQREVLSEQLACIESENPMLPGGPLPVVLHCRKAFDELVPILRSSSLEPSRYVFHCFTGAPSDMRTLLDFGAMVSFTGVVTYKNAQAVREAARLVPLDRVLFETDAPFLSPEPHRGERPCAPRRAIVTARFVAELLGHDWDAFHAQVNRNTESFFGLEAVC